jgi:cobalt-zinc-cadmium efflux system protein
MSRTQRLLVVLVLNLALVAGLVVTGVTAHSLAVLAAGSDYLLDAAGVGVALLAIRLSARHVGNGPRQGSLNASSVAALINSGWLLALEVLVSAAAIDRLITGTPCGRLACTGSERHCRAGNGWLRTRPPKGR